MHDLQPAINYMSQFVTPERMAQLERVAAARTRYLTLLLENVYQPHNASAIIRSCECLGVQDIHIVEQHYRYRANRDIALGSSKWLNLHRYGRAQTNPFAQAVKQLRRRNYRLAAMTLRDDALSVEQIPLDKPVALIFGTELHGLSDEAHQEADFLVTLPIQGFTQSFNISVAAALTLQPLLKRIKDEAVDWKLSPDELAQLKLDWLLKSVREGPNIFSQFLETTRLAGQVE